jgi:hypothetical protein
MAHQVVQEHLSEVRGEWDWGQIHIDTVSIIYFTSTLADYTVAGS